MRTDAHRKYNDRFPYETTKGVKKLLRQAQRLSDARYERADFAAADILIDLQSAMRAAELTEVELHVIIELYVKDNTQEAVGAPLDIKQRDVSRIATSACEKIAGVYKRWNYGKQ